MGAVTPIKQGQTQKDTWSDEDVVVRVLAGQTELFEIIMRRHNTRLYRVARSILRNDAEAEDVMQDAYVRAYEHLRQFAGRAKFSTWLTRIAVHEALARSMKSSRYQSLTDNDHADSLHMELAASGASPEDTASTKEMSVLIETAILALPENYRIVFVLRDVEEMGTAETAASLDITEDNVKVRLHRARAMLRRELYKRVGSTTNQAFPFHAPRCDRVVANVLGRIALLSNDAPGSSL